MLENTIGVKTGSIYRAHPLGPAARPALVLVTSVDETAGTAAVTLLSPDVKLATSEDLLLQGAETRLPYALLAQSDIFGYLSLDQLRLQLAQVDAGTVASLDSIRNEDPLDLMRAGPPLFDRRDPRWTHKLHELARLRELTAPAQER